MNYNFFHFLLYYRLIKKEIDEFQKQINVLFDECVLFGEFEQLSFGDNINELLSKSSNFLKLTQLSCVLYLDNSLLIHLSSIFFNNNSDTKFSSLSLFKLLFFSFSSSSIFVLINFWFLNKQLFS